MHKKGRILIPIFIILAGIAAGWYFFYRVEPEETKSLQGSGTVEAVEVNLAPEASGKVVEIFVQKGDQVAEDDLILRLDDTLLQSQRQRALAALETAVANKTIAQENLAYAREALTSTQIGLESRQLQYQASIDTARLTAQAARESAWEVDKPKEFEQPVWYFTRDEELASAAAEAVEAEQALEKEKDYLNKVISKISDEDLRAAEERLVSVQAAFLVALDVLDRAEAQTDQELEDFAQSYFNGVEAELEAAQLDYENILTETGNEELLEARARVAVAQERYEVALDRWTALKTGTNSSSVQAAQIAVEQAQASLRQAETGIRQALASIEQTEKVIAQAQAEVDWVDVQLSKLSVYSPNSGVVLSRNFETGEVIQMGAPVITIGLLDDLRITVYLPEDQYGRVNLGQTALVTADSFPGEVFFAKVVYIADQAEFTPRNVQTTEGRRTTVFAIELSVDDQEGRLKPGMPVDVDFQIR